MTSSQAFHKAPCCGVSALLLWELLVPAYVSLVCLREGTAVHSEASAAVSCQLFASAFSLCPAMSRAAESPRGLGPILV